MVLLLKFSFVRLRFINLLILPAGDVAVVFHASVFKRRQQGSCHCVQPKIESYAESRLETLYFAQ